MSWRRPARPTCAKRVHCVDRRRARRHRNERTATSATEAAGFTIGQYLICLRGIAWREALRFVHQRERFVSALVRPLVWLFIFAAGFRQILGVSIIPPYETYVLYEVYVTPGLMAMIQLFNGMQSSLSMVYDREMGNMRMLLVSPFPRWFLLTGKLLASTAVSILQVYAYLIVAWLWGVEPPLWGYLAVLPALALSGMMLGALGMLLSSVIRQLENFAGVMNFVIFPDVLCILRAVPAVAGAAVQPGGLHHLPAQPVHLCRRADPLCAVCARSTGRRSAVVAGMTIVFTTGAIIAYDPARGLIARRGGGGMSVRLRPCDDAGIGRCAARGSGGGSRAAGAARSGLAMPADQGAASFRSRRSGPVRRWIRSRRLAAGPAGGRSGA